ATELEAALDASQDLEREREGTAWLWFSPNDKGERAGVGRIVLAGDLLELECLSAQQGERGRALLEQLATAMILHRCTWQENLESILRDYIREERQREPDFGVCGGRRGRDGDCSPPPARTRTGAINASGSYRREDADRQRISCAPSITITHTRANSLGTIRRY